ncbi:MAG: hypothetical protein ACKODL_11355 [Phenylobacterium sp.]
MTKVRKFRVKTRLSSMIKEPGGIHVSEALKRGEAVIASRVDDYLNEIDVCIAGIEANFANPKGDPEEMYRLATNIVTLCAVLPDPALSEVARSLCELIDQTGETGRRNPQAIQVHIASMKLLHRTGLDLKASEEILDSLKKMVAKLDR